MPFFVTDDRVSIYYEDKGEGKPVVLLHGWSGSRLHYGFTAPALRSKFRVITYDHRGHGASDRPEQGLTLNRFAKDLEQLLDYLGLYDVTMVGWSMGAHVLFEYVKNFGTKRLEKAVVVDMSPKLINDDEWKLGLYHGKFDHDDNLNVLSTMCEDWEIFAEEFLKNVAPGLSEEEFKISLKETRTNTPHVMYAMWIAMTSADYRDDLAKIDVPTLVIYGDESTLYSKETAEYIIEKIPKAKIDKFKNCTHMLVLEAPEKFNKTIEEFVLE
ncbi:alpha/beta fold hydrolase [Natranaerofaba carboxydovora]|uniref:alpha/beta fold hydrolase n=1 Tax=Natranaerofaba carboxydovora TaxID=2742683 RepID=UPI001F13EAFF|nr:alpha/beta hydrolase [Natranaerofaba carboxydovora]UMZ73429.1 AB hydrolase superfamily protein YdjP [Natranaerofaba carboxydovora]